MAVIDLGDVKYNVLTAGSGPALMLLHGFTAGADSWSGIQPALASRFELIMPDLLGHGRTDAPPDPSRYRMKSCVDDLIAILTVMGVEKTHLLGYSMGGRVALAAAIEYPQHFASLILESASPGLATEMERRMRVAGDNELADFIEREGVEKFVARWERLPLFSSQERLPPAAAAGKSCGRAGQQLARTWYGCATFLVGTVGRVRHPVPDHGRGTRRQICRNRPTDGRVDLGLPARGGARRRPYRAS
jgi:2-succinyl-6-hydroxy-2,4-cyclohexadiene-1-carboxylate synthase